MDQQQTKFEGWALVEVMGHRRAAGFVTTEYLGGSALLKVVTPEVPPTELVLETDQWLDGERVYAGSRVEVSRPRVEQWIGASSVYAFTPIEEKDILDHAPLRKRILERAARLALPQSEPEIQEDPDHDDVPY